uniref:Uncharacterized protein n=1 Tax=Arundo donax TaxID=35708 RepID=A0A0A8ZMF2_ARUDO
MLPRSLTHQISKSCITASPKALSHQNTVTPS